VNGTPTFFINGYRYEGMNEFEDLVEAIDAVLAERQRERKRAG
jgi:protein-disulfide isomerase